ncbi:MULTISPECIES: MafI family immunity protein [unclassified Micromonospora]|uniref:MafI family immunity protein n=1 Tax=unclassified Micromonospora TaxID=2617518 RepID=UPI003A85C950
MKIDDREVAFGVLRAVVLAVADSLPRRDVESIWGLIDAGEPGVAFENLCTQLDEYEVSTNESTRSDLAAVGDYLGIDARIWQELPR